MYKALVCCKTGMGTGMLLKIKADQVIQENGFPIQTTHGNIDSLATFDGDLVITMDDLKETLIGRFPYVIGIEKVIDKQEMTEKIEAFLETRE